MQRLREIWAYRTLIANLAQRELRAKYKKSVLGWGWSLISPAATLGVYTLVFGVYLKAVPPTMANGMAVVMCGVRHSQINKPNAKRNAETDKIIGIMV